MLIAIIDDGIDFRTYPELQVEYDLVVEEDGSIHPRRIVDLIITDHGTTCARIIHAYAPEASFCSLGIFSTEKLRSNIKQLIAALTWCCEQQIPLIHLSVGSTRLSDYEPLQKIVSRMLCQGQVLVAAHSNKGERYTMPACFSGVFGVAADPLLTGCEFRVAGAIQPDSVWLLASSKHRLKNADGIYEETPLANSYAAPTVSASIHEILTRRDGFVPLVELWRELTCQANVPVTSLRPDFMGKAIVYDPMGSLKHKEEQLAFGILGSSPDSVGFMDALIADPYTPALILSPQLISDSLWSELLEHSKERVGIVCAGTVPQWVREKISCLLWDEGAQRELMTRLFTNELEEIVPILRVEPYCKEAFLLLPKLKRFFAANGIECLVLSDYPQSYLYGVEWLPIDCTPNDRISHICQTAQPDMIICMLHEPFFSTGESATMTLADCGKATFDAAANQAVLPLNPSAEDFQGLLAWMT